MKKTLLIIILCLFPLFTYADECTKEQINQYKKEIENVKLDVKQDKNFTGFDEEKEKAKGYFELSFEGLPNGVSVTAQYNNLIISMDYMSPSRTGLPGGIYTIYFSNDNCPDITIMERKIYIPTYNENEKKWVDITMEQPNSDNNNQNYLTTVLLIILVFVIILLIFLLVNIIKRRQKNEKSV